MLEILSTGTNSTRAVLLLKAVGMGEGRLGKQVAKVWSNHNGLEECNAVSVSLTSLQKRLERVCWKKYMRFLSEMCSRTVLICIFLYLSNVTSHHFVTTTGICTALGEGVNGLAEIKRSVLTLPYIWKLLYGKHVGRVWQFRFKSPQILIEHKHFICF